MAQALGDGARVSGFADAADLEVAYVAADAGDDADGNRGLVERRALLDVQLDEGGDAHRIDQRTPLGEPRRLGAGFAHVERSASVSRPSSAADPR